MLFAKASFDQIEVIKSCVEEFSQVSGLRVNLEKSRLFVSPNVDRNLARSLSSRCDIPLTDNLGTYLGVPIIHKSVSRETYAPVVDKVLKKLADWKGRVLSQAGRRVLIQTTTTSIPLYTMQSAMLLISICNRLDKINSNFLWGGSADTERNHLVSWDKVCSPRNQGGLGLRKIKDYNLAMLAKTGWSLHTRQESLWCEVFKAKYMGDKQFLECAKKAGSSSTWRGILKTQNVFEKGLKWKIGDGSRIRFWNDWWVGAQPLINTLSQQSSEIDVNAKVQDMLSSAGEWNIQQIRDLLPQDQVDEIRGIPLLFNLRSVDSSFWGYSKNGEFTVSSAYTVVTRSGREALAELENLDWIWKLQSPERVRFFIWLLYQNKLNTNEVRVRKGMCDSSLCGHCLNSEESLDHIMRGCTLAFQVWSCSKKVQEFPGFYTIPFQKWVKINCLLTEKDNQGK
ncbi:hypothetical protein REPUB_Repub10bG0106100 [Reevesia pubescens]